MCDLTIVFSNMEKCQTYGGLCVAVKTITFFFIRIYFYQYFLMPNIQSVIVFLADILIFHDLNEVFGVISASSNRMITEMPIIAFAAPKQSIDYQPTEWGKLRNIYFPHKWF